MLCKQTSLTVLYICVAYYRWRGLLRVTLDVSEFVDQWVRHCESIIEGKSILERCFSSQNHFSYLQTGQDIVTARPLCCSLWRSRFSSFWKVLLHVSQAKLGALPAPSCFRWCFLKRETSEKALSHRLHLYGFSPVWILRWFATLYRLIKKTYQLQNIVEHSL